MGTPDVQRHLLSFATDVLRLTVWLALLLMVFVPLERLAGLHPNKVFRKSFAVDLGYYFVNNLIPKLLLAAPTALISWGMRSILPDEWQLFIDDLPLWARLAAAWLVSEIGFYWGHRWAHQIPLLWRFHAVHHTAEEIDWLVNTRAHPLDIVFVRLCGLAPLYALGLAQPVGAAGLDVVPLLLMIGATLWGFFVHANLRWRFGWLGLLIATPQFHHWHHTRDEHVDRNYASMLPFLDKLFGTWYLPKAQWPTRYGTDTPVAAGLTAQLLQPLLPEDAKVMQSEPRASASGVRV